MIEIMVNGYRIAKPDGIADLRRPSAELSDRFALVKMFSLCSHVHMERVDRARLADILLNAPAWARVGLTVRDSRLRERAADTLAATIVERIEERPAADRDQLPLPLGG